MFCSDIFTIDIDLNVGVRLIENMLVNFEVITATLVTIYISTAIL